MKDSSQITSAILCCISAIANQTQNNKSVHYVTLGSTLHIQAPRTVFQPLVGIPKHLLFTGSRLSVHEAKKPRRILALHPERLDCSNNAPAACVLHRANAHGDPATEPGSPGPLERSRYLTSSSGDARDSLSVCTL